MRAKKTLCIAVGTLLLNAVPVVADVEATVVDRPPSNRASTVHGGNRAPLNPGALIKLPVASFKPSGWLLAAMERQRDGLTGHLGEVSKWLAKDDNAWLKADGTGKWGWEEVPYWLRGYSRLAYILGDERMLDETKVWIEAVLGSQRPDGDFGPVQVRRGKRDLWAQMLMLQVLQSWHEFSGDARVIPFMTRYFAWEMTIPDGDFLEDYWENSRGGDNLASVYWLYNRTGDSSLLDLATKIDRNTANWRQKDDLPNWHVVNIAECFREPAEYWLQSGKKEDLDASYRNFRLVRERYGQVPGGMFGADENARPGHTDPHQAAETCSFVEQIWSNLIMTEITGDPSWAENTEDVAFNTLPAAFTPDCRALRYLTAPNQVTADAKNHAPGVANEGPFFLMNPFSSRCCQHNHSSAWVNYAEHAWMATNDNGLAAVVYAGGELYARAGAAQGAVRMVIETRYPFQDRVKITVRETPPGGFPIYVRVPDWADGAVLSVNGAAVDIAPKPAAFVRIENEWKAGDVIELTFPMHVRWRTWVHNSDGVSVNYGPLTFSLRIDEKYSKVESEKTAQHDAGWQADADPRKWPSFEIMPGSAWNYALLRDGKGDENQIQVVRRPWPANDDPFTNAGAPIVLKAKARKVPSWTLDDHGLVGSLPRSPVETPEPIEDITLVPMGGARLRISVFPVAAK